MKTSTSGRIVDIVTVRYGDNTVGGKKALAGRITRCRKGKATDVSEL